MPIFEVQSPDGKFYELDAPNFSAAVTAFQGFAELSPGREQGVSVELTPEAQTRVKEIESKGGTGLTQNLIQGLTSGFGDEVMAGVGSLMQGGMPYAQELEVQREMLRRGRKNYPIGALVAEIAGAIATVPILPQMKAAQGARLFARAGAGAVTGAGYGGLYGIGTGENPQERMMQGLTGATVGSALGGPLGALGGRAAPTGPTGGQLSVQAAGRLGLEQYPKVAALDNPAAKVLALTASKIPYAGTPIHTAIEASSTELGKRTQTVASDFLGGALATGRAEAGGTARKSIERYIGPTMEKNAQRLYDAVDFMVDKTIKTPLLRTMQQAQDIVSKRGAAMMNEGGAVGRIIDAAKDPGGLTYEGIKTLRTSIGEDIKRGILPEGMSNSELKRIYAGLTDDLRTAAQNAGGPKAVSTFDRANSYYKFVSERREELASLLGTKSDEALFDAILRKASAKGGADIDLLMKARKAIKDPEEWNQIASTSASRLGQMTKGNPATFNPAIFSKEYGNLTPKGKAILFDSTGRSDLRMALDDIQTIGERLKDVRFFNPSGTAQPVMATGLGAVGMAEAIASGGIPVATVTGLLGTAVVSKILASPATAQSMARWSRAYEYAIRKPGQATLTSLNGASRIFASTIGKELGLEDYIPQIEQSLMSAGKPNG